MEPSGRKVGENSAKEAPIQGSLLGERPRCDEIEHSGIEERNEQDEVHGCCRLLRMRVEAGKGDKFDEDGSQDEASKDDQEGC